MFAVLVECLASILGVTMKTSSGPSKRVVLVLACTGWFLRTAWHSLLLGVEERTRGRSRQSANKYFIDHKEVNVFLLGQVKKM